MNSLENLYMGLIRNEGDNFNIDDKVRIVDTFCSRHKSREIGIIVGNPYLNLYEVQFKDGAITTYVFDYLEHISNTEDFILESGGPTNENIKK